MNKITKIAAGIALVSCATVSTSAFADVSANIGFASEYYFRGVLQKEASASAGVDFEASGAYAGVWTADVGDGLEYDLYAGYGISLDNGISASIGFTGYYYTGNTFDDTYEEVNLNVGVGFISVEYSFGEHTPIQSVTIGGNSIKEDYTFTAVTLEQNGFYGTAGFWGDEFNGHYYEVGYGFTAMDIDFGIAGIFSEEDLRVDGESGSDEAIVFTIGKTF